IVSLLKELDTPVQYVIVNEAGASVYSASKLATEEFPQFDVGQRSAASIARRLQDPLAELVKIDPKSIGVGQYQHDMDQKKLGESLGGVVENCVNTVGVDLNTASASLLEYISGISKPIAKNIVAYREENGRFKDRRELLKVPKLGPKAFEQCAGFLRITGGTNPLDATGVHPESYAAAEELLKRLGLTTADIGKVHAEQREENARAEEAQKAQENRRPGKERREKPVHINTNSAMGQALLAALGKAGLDEGKTESREKAPAKPAAPVKAASSLSRQIGDKKKLAEELGIGEITLEDIIKEIEKPGRDPREEMPRPILRTDVMDMADLKEGMILKGTVRNVIDFGVFVDIGVHQDGLVHISQITNKRYIKHPLDAVSVGDVVEVKVLGVDTKKKRISLTMIL
ncbi:MAG: helix-hairpin-helix domain-containing protein, partial [Lachnospiraceae bacterium]|nr:helix-hairpin-helix domain-containing protein [Lachnospiraceae bacterium]